MKNSSGEGQSKTGPQASLRPAICSAVRWIVEIRDREFPDLWQSVEVRKDEEAANAKVKEWAQWLIDMKKPPRDIRLVKETTAREIIEPNSGVRCDSDERINPQHSTDK